MLPSHLVSALGAYLRSLVREGHLAFGDPQSQRYYRHNEPVVSLFHHELVGLVQHVARTSVKPTYCYLAAYEPGAILKRDVHRAQCELSISLQIAYEPQPRGVYHPGRLGGAEGQARPSYPPPPR